jgi:hypothetical protein
MQKHGLRDVLSQVRVTSDLPERSRIDKVDVAGN